MTAARCKVIAVLVTALLVAGCSDEPRPRFEEPTDSPGSPSASDSASASAEPEPWQVKSRAGAEAFAEHWIETFNEAVLSGDTSELASLSADGCGTCDGFIERIESVYDAGGSYRAHEWTITQSAVVSPKPATQPTLVIRIRRAPERFKESAGETFVTNGASRATFRVDTRWRQGGWLMQRMVLFK